MPLIDYVSVMWSGSSSTSLDPIPKLQKRIVRIILLADYTTSTSAMFQELGWQHIHRRLSYHKTVMTYKALKSQTPEYITNLLRPISKTHRRSLKSSDNGTLWFPGRLPLYLTNYLHVQLQNFGTRCRSLLEIRQH